VGEAIRDEFAWHQGVRFVDAVGRPRDDDREIAGRR
jgi:hypothetical protein